MFGLILITLTVAICHVAVRDALVTYLEGVDLG